MHTIKTKKDKDGVETKTEDFINIDESKSGKKNVSPAPSGS